MASDSQSRELLNENIKVKGDVIMTIAFSFKKFIFLSTARGLGLFCTYPAYTIVHILSSNTCWMNEWRNKEINHGIQDKKVSIKKPVAKIIEESCSSGINKLNSGKMPYSSLQTLKQTKQKLLPDESLI